MASIIAEFFQITGIDVVPPETLAELIPYILTVVVGVALVSGAFGVLGKLASIILDMTKWR